MLKLADLAGRADFSVGPLRVSPARRLVEGPAGSAYVEPIVMKVFLLLLDARGDVVTRDELFASAWGGVFVGDDSLNRAIARVRKVAAQTAPGLIEIERIPRTGYRLTGEILSSQNQVDRKSDGARHGGMSRRAVAAGGAAVLAVGGAGLWRAQRQTRLGESQRWTDRGDILLRDAVPMQAGEALPPLRTALDINPKNARALGLLALAEETRANNGGSSNAGDTLRFAERAARAALQRDENEPHARLAMIDMTAGSLDWSQMEDRLEALRASSPDNLHVLGSLTSFLQAAGRTSKSWLYNEQAAAAAPASPTPQWRRTLRLWTARRTDEALKLSERLLPLWPRHALVWNARFMILAFTGRTGAAAAMLRDAVGPPANAHPARLAQWLPTFEAFAEPTPTRIATAREANLAAAQLNPGQATYAAMVLGQLGELDAAFDVIDALLLSKGPLVPNRPIVPRSFVANSPSWCRTQWLFMPPLAAARRDPRFEALCEELGLARYWRQRGVAPDTRLPG
jgi:DNA-binding winged helix-turn-helix (wHTH) protein/tetratricopeptide (TPR) repeat protein